MELRPWTVLLALSLLPTVSLAAGKCDRLVITGSPDAPPYLWRDPQDPTHLIGATAAMLQQVAKDLGVKIDPGDVRRGRSERRRLVHVIPGLRPRANQTLVFQVRVGLQHGGVADVELGAHFAYRRHALARLIDTASDILSQLLGDTLVEQQIGHDAALDFTGILFLCETYRHSLEVYGDSCHNSRAQAGVTVKTVGVVKRFPEVPPTKCGSGLARECGVSVSRFSG